ncbi:MAG: SDR family NAD(P)-dependent oxidoreductase, partial [Acidobacteriaceae bacterium]
VEGNEIDYVETHGTGTSLGDPIEAHALAAIYGANRSSSHPLVVGAVKTNIGHLESAAGIAGLMKAVLSLEHEQIPANLHFREMNPHIDWAGVPVCVPVEAIEWPRSDRPRRAGVSSFGFSGTNAHVIVEEAPEEAAAQRERERPAHLLVLSARSEAALGQLAQGYGEALEGLAADVGDICYTAGAGRAHFTHRLAVTGSSRGQLRERLLGALPGKAVREREGVRAVFLFPGQGAQYAGMGRELYESQPVFRRSLEECAELLTGKLEKPLLEVLWGGSTELLEQTAYTQPSLFAIEYALSELWRSWGIEPGAVLGHSVGEYVAACVAGMCTLGEGLQLIALRGRLMQGAKGRGAMAAVRAGEDRVRLALKGLEGRVAVAAINAPESVVISGYEAEVEEAGGRLSREGIGIQRLSVSHGFHSPQMEEMEEEFAAAAGEVRWKEPRLVLISSVTGRAVVAGEMSQPGYWRRQVRQPVRFQEGIEALAGYRTFVEAGPGSTLSGLGQQCLEGGERLWVQSLRKNRGEWEQMLGALGSLYVQGAEVNWAGYDEPYARRRIPLPTYPFERQRYWVDVTVPQRPRGVSATQAALSEAVSVSDNVDRCTYEISWQVKLLKPTQQGIGVGRWLIVSDGHGLAATFANRIRDLGGAPVTVRPNEIDPSLASSDVVVYLASSDRYASRELDPSTMEVGLSESLAGLLPLAKWITAAERRTKLWVVTSGAQAVTVGEPPAHCLQAALWGVARTFALENRDSWGGIVDLDSGAALDGSSALLLDAILQNDGEDQTAIRNGQRYVPRLQNRALSQYPDPVFSADKVYLITGGMGGLGLLVTRWMADHGARKLALMGRRPPSAEASEVLESLRAGGVQAETYAVDIAESSELAEVFHKIVAIQGPICGVMHLAGVLDDGMLVQQSWDRFARVLAPKTLGAWNLHHLTLNSGPLDFFVLFSSFASVTGSFGQANYAAANAVLDALAHYRKAHGLTATSLNWGGWAEAGMAARTVARGKSQAGAQLLPPQVALAALGRALAAALPQIGVAVIDWSSFSRAHPGQKFLEQVAATTEHTGPLPETAKPKSFLDQFRQIPKEERSRRLLDHLTQLLAQVLGVPLESLNPQTDITDFGLDSLMALELRNQITADLGVSIPVVRLLEGLSLAGLQIWITGQVVEAVEDSQPLASTDAETEFPLSYGQHAGLFGHKMLPEFAFSNVALTAKASPPLDRASFRRSVERMTERHAILRTVFLEDQEGQQVQRVLSSVPPPAEFIDAAGWTDEEIRERLQEDFGRPFDVTRPMFSIKVFEQRDADVIYFKVDHLIIDHWSVGIFIEDLREIYSADVAGRHHNLLPIEAEYRDFVEWERNLMSSPAADRMWAYWQKTLSGVPDLCLPSSRPRPDVLLAQGECIRIHIDAASFQEIKRAARKHRCTAYTFLLAAFHLLL